jgi:hypothetical protein
MQCNEHNCAKRLTDLSIKRRLTLKLAEEYSCARSKQHFIYSWIFQSVWSHNILLEVLLHQRIFVPSDRVSGGQTPRTHKLLDLYLDISN